MAVVHCEEVHGRSVEQDINGNKRYAKTFQLVTDDPTDGAKAVHDFPGLPAYGQVHPEDANAFVVAKRPRHDDSGHPANWFCAVEYAGRDDPVSEPPEVSWSVTKYQKAVQRDVNDVPFVNSAGDPFESGATVDRTRFVLMIRRNVMTWDPTTSEGYIDSLNQGVFLAERHPPGFAAGTCKLSDLGADAVWLEDRSDIHFWRVTAKIEVNTEGWQTVVLDAGMHELVTNSVVIGGIPVDVTYKKAILLWGGNHAVSPQPLDGEGHALNPGDAPVYLPPFEFYETKDWTGLDLEY